ncbi:hypothetical protein BHM03_00009512 [Ensete ventricosum]|nr:hypothetical protein BHM03_00009512 [Ensete ventricosum]
MTLTLTGFTEDTITPLGVTTFPITFDDEPRTETFIVPFVVVDLSLAYNVIIGIKNFTTEASEAGLRENLDMLEERRAKTHKDSTLSEGSRPTLQSEAPTPTHQYGRPDPQEGRG